MRKSSSYMSAAHGRQAISVRYIIRQLMFFSLFCFFLVLQIRFATWRVKVARAAVTLISLATTSDESWISEYFAWNVHRRSGCLKQWSALLHESSSKTTSKIKYRVSGVACIQVDISSASRDDAFFFSMPSSGDTCQRVVESIRPHISPLFWWMCRISMR